MRIALVDASWMPESVKEHVSVNVHSSVSVVNGPANVKTPTSKT
jgi:hypothetical protein